MTTPDKAKLTDKIERLEETIREQRRARSQDAEQVQCAHYFFGGGLLLIGIGGTIGTIPHDQIVSGLIGVGGFQLFIARFAINTKR